MIRPTMLILVCFSTFFLFSCNNETAKEPEKNISGKPVSVDTVERNTVTKKYIDMELDLISLEIVDSNSNDIYKRFGIISAGMCYDCDLANILISNGKIQFSNICDSTNSINYDISNIEKKQGSFELYTKENSFMLEPVNAGPIFSLTLKGNLKLSKNLKIVKYYTARKDILKFKVHDCGDFGG